MFFLTLWVFRFASVLLRINIDKLRHFQACSWLNYVKMLTYEEDLEQFIRESNNLMTESPVNYRFKQKEKRIEKIKLQGFYDDSSSSDGSITILGQQSYPAKLQQNIQNKRMLKHASPSNRLYINHDDLLNLPKKSYKKGNKKNAELKKKKKGLKPHVLKGISPQFTLTRTNIEIFSQTIKEEDSIISGLNSSGLAQSNPQEKEQSYNNRLPYF